MISGRSRPLTFLLVLAIVSLAPPAFAQRGKQIFQRECSGCHGPAGEGGRGPTLATPKLPRARDLTTMREIIDEGIAGTEMPPARLSSSDQRQVALWVQQLGKRPPEKIPGDRTRGQALYASKGGCAVCHSVGGHGGATGPDLSDIGLRRGVAHLRAALIDPEAALPRS